MTVLSDRPGYYRPTPYRARSAVVALHVTAMLLLGGIIWCNATIWPIPLLGYIYDSETAQIVALEPGSPAAAVGLRVGDVLLRLYDRPWNQVLWSWNVIPLIGSLAQPIPITVLRQGAPVDLGIMVGQPSPAYQAVKVAYSALALLCWLTGYLLGIVRRQELPIPRFVALFWLAASGVCGSYLFAVTASTPLRLALHWLLVTLLVPMMIALHVWYPVRHVMRDKAHHTRRWLAGSIVLLNVVLAAWLLAVPASLMLVDLNVPPMALILGVIMSGGLLSRNYRTTLHPHSRRQIRLIATACLLVGLIWTYTFFSPFVNADLAFALDPLTVLAPALIPLAYLVGGLVPDLYRVDRLFRRSTAHVVTFTVLVGLLLIVQYVVAPSQTALFFWSAACVVTMYRPLQRLSLRLLAPDTLVDMAYQPIDQAVAALAASLERTTLVEACVTGVQAAFGRPAIAFYGIQSTSDDMLELGYQAHMSLLPPTLACGMLAQACQQHRSIIDTPTLHASLCTQALTPEESQLLQQPGIALWCPIQDAQGRLLGLLMLGSRGDLEPYRDSDIRKFQQLLDAAALAFANSAAYEQQRQAEATIRALYRHVQEVQDATAAAIVREIHDELININVRLNIEALQRLLADPLPPLLHTELALILESEQTLVQALRLICNRIKPTGLDDPFGLPTVLRLQVERTRAIWKGECALEVQGTPCAVPSAVQHEALRITREALTNAIKHAQASQIAVELAYPLAEGEPLHVRISDNGRGRLPFATPAGHWGLQNMDESARVVNGSVTFAVLPDGGIMVRFTCPLEAEAAVNHLEQVTYGS